MSRPPPEAHLLVLDGPHRGQRFDLPPALSERGCPVGRAAELPVSLPRDPFVSRENALIRWDGRCFQVVDVPTSRNGVEVNDVRSPRGQPVPLRDGDLVRVGASVLRFSTGVEGEVF